MAQRILVVDDDKSIVKVLRGYLEQSGYQVLTAGDGETALHMLRRERPDLVVLDLMLPNRDGWEIARIVRADKTLAATPIIMLTARVEDTDKIVGLELGADDYITKPFNAHEELVARVKALLRRTRLDQLPTAAPSVLVTGGLRLDLDQHTLTVDGSPVELTRTKFKLLEAFMENPGYTLTHDDLLEKAMGYAYEGMGRALDTHIRNLRRKIEPNPDDPAYIQTVYGVGYRLTGSGHMNRLWVRLSLMIGGVLLLVFFVQFLAVLMPDEMGGGPAPLPATAGASQLPDGEPPPGEIAHRLFKFAVLSVFVGLGAGVLISRVISAPVSDLAKAAQRIGEGDLQARVPARGSREMVELAATFNKMAADLEHAETMRNNLMADVSHELRTPLTVLEGNLRAALDRVYTLDEAEIANLYGQTRHLIRLVNDLRELALAENHQLPLEKEAVDLNALLAETLQALEPLAVEKGVRLSDRADRLPEVTVDPIRIRQVLFNLLSNALRHTPPGGEIIVTGASGEGEVHLNVQDTGDGLEPDQLASIFDRFYRADRSRSRETGGTGLGLTIVKAIIEAHGGHVAAQSAGRGRGSTFSIVLPLP